MNSLADKLDQCHAATNKSFDPQDTSLETFRQAWDRILPQLMVVAVQVAQDTSTTTTAVGAAAEGWIQRLWTLHVEPTRHYHTAVHVQEMLEYFELLRRLDESKSFQQQQPITQQDAVVTVMSIYFHDAIYNPQSATNEEDSEQLWQEFAKEMQITNKELIQEVSTFILATKQHKVSNENSPSLALFLDLDLAVLAKEPSAYLSYAALIRREYHFVPVETYCSKRAEILQDMANQTKLYGSAVFAPWEDRARNNLRNEIKLLKQGSIPAA